MKRTRNTLVPKKSVLVFAASAFEASYFSQVRKDCRYTNLTVLLSDEAPDFAGFIAKAARARTKGKYDSVWALFSLDDFGMVPADLKDAYELSAAKKVKLAYCYPGLSLWFYLHFKSPSAPVKDASALSSALASPLKNYAQTQEYLLGDGNSLHLMLFKSFSKAIANARAYNFLCEGATGYKGTTVPDLYAEILEICGNADITHNQKLLGVK